MSAADPLNLTGIVTPGERIAALVRNRVLYRDGVPVAALEGGKMRRLAELEPTRTRELEAALVRRKVPPALRLYLGKVSLPGLT